MAGRKRIYDDDDGRTIANMDVDGMPWYSGGSRRGRRREGEDNSGKSPMSPTERRATLFAVACAALLIAAIFGIGYFLLIFLMDRYMHG
jgi:hypothetical protein